MVFRGARVTVAGAAALPMAMLTTDVSAVRVARLRKLNAQAAIGVCKNSLDAEVTELTDSHETTCVALGDCKKTGVTTVNQSAEDCEARGEDFTWTANTWEEGTCADPTGTAVDSLVGTACETLGQCTAPDETVDQGREQDNCGVCSLASLTTQTDCEGKDHSSNTFTAHSWTRTWNDADSKCIADIVQASCSGNNLSYTNSRCEDGTYTDQTACEAAGECTGDATLITKGTCEAKGTCDDTDISGSVTNAECTDDPVWTPHSFDANTWTAAEAETVEPQVEEVESGSSSSSANRAGLAFTSVLTVLAMLFRS